MALIKDNIHGLVRERLNSCALAMELRLSCINLPTWLCVQQLAQTNSKETSRPLHTSTLWGEPSIRTSNEERVSMSWRYHGYKSLKELNIVWKNITFKRIIIQYQSPFPLFPYTIYNSDTSYLTHQGELWGVCLTLLIGQIWLVFFLS